jgi:hypothetical protein
LLLFKLGYHVIYRRVLRAYKDFAVGELHLFPKFR